MCGRCCRHIKMKMPSWLMVRCLSHSTRGDVNAMGSGTSVGGRFAVTRWITVSQDISLTSELTREFAECALRLRVLCCHAVS